LYFAPYLRSGKIYLCSKPIVIDTFNRKFGTTIPSVDYPSIHKVGITGWDILISIRKSAVVCRYCVTKPYVFDWAYTKFDREEWNAFNN